MESECRAPLSNSEVYAAGQSLGDTFLGVLSSEVTVASVRRAREFAVPSATYGLRYCANQAAILDYRPVAGWDLHVVDIEGILQNDLASPSGSAPLEGDEPPLMIAMFGGSTMMGQGSRLPSFTIPALTSRLLSEALARPVRCLNFGLGGTASADAYRLLVDEVGLMAPDAVVFYDGWNDCTYYSLLDAISLHGEPGLIRRMASKSQGIRQLEMELSIAYMNEPARAAARAWRTCMNGAMGGVGESLQGRVGTRLRRRASAKYSIGIHEVMNGIVPEMEHTQWEACAQTAAERYLRIDALTREYCTERGIRFLHALQPLLLWGTKPLTAREKEWAASGYSSGPLAPYAPFKSTVSDAPGQPVLDLTQIFVDMTDEVYIDSGHINRLGNLIVAKNLAELLVETLKKD